MLTPNVALLFSVAAFTSAVVAWAWRRRGQSSKTLMLLLLAAIIWTLGKALDTGSCDLATKFFLEKVKYFGIVAIPIGWMVYALQQTGREKWASRRNIALLSTVPLVSLALVLTNEAHGLFFSQVTLDPSNPYFPLNETWGLGFTLFIGYIYALLLATSLLAVQMLVRSRHLYTRQAIALLLTALLPWIFAVLFQLTNAFAFDPTPLVISIAGAALALINPTRLRMEDIISVAHGSVVEGMIDPVIVLDESNRIVDLNPAVHSLTNLPKSQIIGSQLEPMFPGFPIRTEEQGAIGRKQEFELVKGDEHLVFDVGISPIVDWRGRVNCRVVVLRDVTERKRAEENLKQYSEHLEELVEERTRKLRQAERMATIGELAAMVAHDLRNPLTGIAGATYYLKTRADSKLSEKEKDMLATTERAIDYSNKIINDLLDYSMEMKLDRSETDPKSLLEEALSRIEAPAGIAVVNETKPEPRLKVDKGKMQRAFINIIKNAFDAMPNGGVLTIRSDKTENHVCFSFIDTGTGMSEETLQKLWTPLFTTKAKGMGFGLPICERIVEAHGGKISVESNVGKGTTLAITIPTNRTAEDKREVWANLPEPLSSTVMSARTRSREENSKNSRQTEVKD